VPWLQTRVVNPRALSCEPAVSVPGPHTRRELRRLGPRQNGRAQRCADRAETVSSNQPRHCLPPDTDPTRRRGRLPQRDTAKRHIDDDQTRDAPLPIPGLARLLATPHLTTTDTPPSVSTPQPRHTTARPQPGTWVGRCGQGENVGLEILRLGNAFFSSATANSPCQLIDKRHRSRADAFQVFWQAFLCLP